MVKANNIIWFNILLIVILAFNSDSVFGQIDYDTTSIKLYASISNDKVKINDSILLFFKIENISNREVTICFYDNVTLLHKDYFFEGPDGFINLCEENKMEKQNIVAGGSIERKVKIYVKDYYHLNENRFYFVFFSHCTINKVASFTDELILNVE